MADLFNYGNPDRDIEQALVALKRGTQLIKCSRKGKPKLRSFRLSSDETTLIWISHKKQKSIKLPFVTKIIPGQRTAVFGRYPLPEKDYLSFSLVYRNKNDERTLDLICKDQAEVEIWFSGLQTLINSNSTQPRKSRSETSSDITFSDEGGDSVRNNSRALTAVLDLSLGANRSLSPSKYLHLNSGKSDHAGHSPEHPNMIIRGSTSGSNVDVGRLSVSSAPGSSNVAEDIESLGDVFVWGEVWTDGPQFQKADVLSPKQLETDVAIDVQQVAGGVGHAALVTRQGDVFTWGEEFSGRLGRGNELSASRPKPVEVFSNCNMEVVACGEFHTCAINIQGEMFTWGDDHYKAGLLGHGSEAGHSLPKRVSGSLEGIRVIGISCGSWHTALVTFNNKLFTFGEGAFGALGHGDRESINYPKEIKKWSGLEHLEKSGVVKTEVRGIKKVACGMWHTAAIFEVVKSNKLNEQLASPVIFTWGDGAKYRLGQGDKEARLVPTLVESLCSYNFHQIACGHNLTVALTTSGRVITMGDPTYGQLGTSKVNNEKSPNLVILTDVEDIACGAAHVVALTQRSELYTWGRGANGRLGHGDTEDRDKPTLVESLRDRHVKSISCGASFTACICIHKWVPTNDQSVCAGCRQSFGFARKRHTCYHCGLVHCHACSSRKALKAQLAPNPGKPHRVCDLCFAKLNANETISMATVASNRYVVTRRSTDQGRASRLLLQSPVDPVRYSDVKPVRNEGKSDSLSIIRASQVQSLLPLPTSLSALHAALRPIVTSSGLPSSNGNSNGGTVPGSPYSRRPSPPPTTPFFTKNVYDNQKKIIDTLQNELQQLQIENGELKRQKEMQDKEIHNVLKKAKKAAAFAAKENAKCNATFDLVRKFESQLKEIGDMPPEVLETLDALRKQSESIKQSHGPSDQDQPRFLADNTSNAYEEESSVQVQGSASSSTENPFEESEDRFEPGVYVTYAQFRDGSTAFRRVRFNRKRYLEHQAEEWWKDNKDRVIKHYNNPNPNPDAVQPVPPLPPPLPRAANNGETSGTKSEG